MTTEAHRVYRCPMEHSEHQGFSPTPLMCEACGAPLIDFEKNKQGTYTLKCPAREIVATKVKVVPPVE
jgi:hypothetical protein